MSVRLDRLGEDRARALRKREEWDAKYKELDRLYKERENTEIHDIVHAANLTPDQLAMLIQTLGQGLPSGAVPETITGAAATITKNMEDTDDEDYFDNERNANGIGNKALLSINRTISIALDYAISIGWRTDNPACNINPCLVNTTPFFTSFLRDWLKMMKTQVAVTTYSAYSRVILNQIIPYFDEHHPRIRLDAVTAKHIQDYYTYELEVRHVSANTVKHRHANIHKALSYAYKTDMIQTNPADKVELPRIEKYSGNVYSQKQLEELFNIFKGDPAEFGVVTAAFYGLRRSEVLGLEWDAVDFEKKTITIKHTIQEVQINGKFQIVACDRTKTKSSCRTLPLVAPYEEILLRMKASQAENRKLCGSCYCTDYLDYIYYKRANLLK